jgi:hypothetical protein
MTSYKIKVNILKNFKFLMILGLFFNDINLQAGESIRIPISSFPSIVNLGMFTASVVKPAISMYLLHQSYTAQIHEIEAKYLDRIQNAETQDEKAKLENQLHIFQDKIKSMRNNDLWLPFINILPWIALFLPYKDSEQELAVHFIFLASSTLASMIIEEDQQRIIKEALEIAEEEIETL